MATKTNANDAILTSYDTTQDILKAKLYAINDDTGALVPVLASVLGQVYTKDQTHAGVTTDQVGAVLATSEVYDVGLGTSFPGKFAAVAANTSGDNSLIAAVASKKIRVLSMALVATGAVSLYFTSAASGTVIFGGSTNKIALAANGVFVLPFNPLGWFQNSSVNQALIMNLSGAVAVSGGINYVEVG